MDMTRISVSWKNGSKVDISPRTIFRGGHILDDIRRSIPTNPLGEEVYWRDDVFDPEIFHAHRKVKHPFDALGESIGTAHVVRK